MTVVEKAKQISKEVEEKVIQVKNRIKNTLSSHPNLFRQYTQHPLVTMTASQSKHASYHFPSEGY